MLDFVTKNAVAGERASFEELEHHLFLYPTQVYFCRNDKAPEALTRFAVEEYCRFYSSLSADHREVDLLFFLEPVLRQVVHTKSAGSLAHYHECLCELPKSSSVAEKCFLLGSERYFANCILLRSCPDRNRKLLYTLKDHFRP